MGIVGVFAVLLRLIVTPILLLMQMLWLLPVIAGVWFMVNYFRGRFDTDDEVDGQQDVEFSEPTRREEPQFRGEVKTVSYTEVPDDEEIDDAAEPAMPDDSEA